MHEFPSNYFNEIGFVIPTDAELDILLSKQCEALCTWVKEFPSLSRVCDITVGDCTDKDLLQAMQQAHITHIRISVDWGVWRLSITFDPNLRTDNLRSLALSLTRHPASEYPILIEGISITYGSEIHSQRGPALIIKDLGSKWCVRWYLTGKVVPWKRWVLQVGNASHLDLILKHL